MQSNGIRFRYSRDDGEQDCDHGVKSSPRREHGMQEKNLRAHRIGNFETVFDDPRPASCAATPEYPFHGKPGVRTVAQIRVDMARTLSHAPLD